MVMEAVRSYRDLEVSQKAMELAVMVYALTRNLPRQEEHRLSAQLIRASASVPANIAEGHMRGTRRDYANFISIARGSLAETETFLMLVQRLDLVPEAHVNAALDLANQIGRMLTRLRQRLTEPNP
jgi:four helix bundle protein